MNKISLIILSIAVISASCASLKTTKSADSEAYREDLRANRPAYLLPADTVGTGKDIAVDYSQVQPKNDITEELNVVLDESDEFRKDIKFVDGFTIQVYTGNSSDDARIIKGKALSALPNENIVLFYDEPSFKVKVGKYLTRIEAQQSYTVLKNKFPTAIIIPEKIAIP